MARLWTTEATRPAQVDECPFCEGRELHAGREILAWRPSGEANAAGWRVRVVANRLPALRVESHYGEATSGAMFQSMGGLGAHEVIIEHPRHDADWHTMSVDEIQMVLWAWRERIADLRRDVRLKSFLVTKNVGVEAGATMPHAHSQLLALPFVPMHLDDEMHGARARFDTAGHCVFCTMIAAEIDAGVRTIGHDALACTFAPFASRVPFEVWVVPRQHQASFDQEPDATLHAVARQLGDVVRQLCATLGSPAYSVLLHTAPVGEGASFHWHLELVPRLAPVNGLAWEGGTHINPIAPEEAARALREAVVAGA